MQLIQLQSGMAHSPISLCTVALRSRHCRCRDQSVVEQLWKQKLFNTGSAKRAGRLDFARLWSMDMCRCRGTGKVCDRHRPGETSLQRYALRSATDTYRQTYMGSHNVFDNLFDFLCNTDMFDILMFIMPVQMEIFGRMWREIDGCQVSTVERRRRQNVAGLRCRKLQIFQSGVCCVCVGS